MDVAKLYDPNVRSILRDPVACRNHTDMPGNRRRSAVAAWFGDSYMRSLPLWRFLNGAASQPMRQVRTGLSTVPLQTAYLITKTDCSRCLEWPLAAITGSFRHPAGVFSCRLGREDRPKLAGACLIRRRCAASPACLGSISDLYSPGAVRPRYCGILRRLQARVPACGGSRTGHNSAA